MSGPGAGRTLLLLGGGEWQQAATAADSWWLARAERRLVTVVTSAAQDIPDQQVSWAAAHFERLGATVEGCLIQSRADAHDPALLEQLAAASAIYLCGGDPAAAREVLAGSPAAQALRRSYRAGIPLAGSSAGAMVLGRSCLLPGRGFALGPGVAVIEQVVVPHWSSVDRSWRRRAAELAGQGQVIGIDESTGLCWDGAHWEQRGPGQVVLVGERGSSPLAEGELAPPLE